MANPLTKPLLPPRFDPFARPDSSGRIVGGHVIKITEASWQISLQDRDFHICGGSIIHPKFVLTAAHCTDGAFVSTLNIRAGSDYYRTGGIKVKVAKIHQHPSFSYITIDYDYSILELESELKFSDKIGTIGLPKHDEDVDDNAMCLVSGWGNTQNSSQSRDKLRGALVPKTNQEMCKEAYQFFGKITGRMICAGFEKGQVDACQGYLVLNYMKVVSLKF